MPSLCRKSSAFYTTLAGIVSLVAWSLFPEVRVFAHPIYMEWVVCLATFLIVALVDNRKIDKSID